MGGFMCCYYDRMAISLAKCKQDNEIYKKLKEGQTNGLKKYTSYITFILFIKNRKDVS